MNIRLDGRVALVTGAGNPRGIGAAVCRQMADAGAGVIATDLEPPEWLADEIRGRGAQAISLPMDVRSEASVAAAVDQAARLMGPIDIAVNNAGLSRSTPLAELEAREFDEVLAVNLRGGFLVLRAVLPSMLTRRFGRLIWMSSIAGKQGGGIFGSAHYATAKAGIIGLCQAVARELAAYGVTSNAVAPGLIDTGFVARSSSHETEDLVRSSYLERVPARRLGSAEEVAGAIMFLASDQAAYITGEILDVNGGAYFD